jgi:VWFA-related protein
MLAVAQQAAEGGSGNTPVFHSEVRQVLVDAVVMDKSGNYISNLTAKDFKLIEDGKEQQVLGITKQSDAQLSTPQYVVLLMDQMTFDAQRAARQNAKSFAEHVVGPRRFMALLSYQGNGSITIDLAPSNNIAALNEAIDNMKSATVSSNAPVGGTRSVGATSVSTGQNGYTTTGQATNTNAFQNQVASGVDKHNVQADMTEGDADYGVRSLLSSLLNLCKTLSTLPGRKSIIWMTPGFYVDSNQQHNLTDVIAQANKGNVSFYPVQSSFGDAGTYGGAVSEKGAGGGFSESSLRQTLREMAEKTGGFTVGGNNDLGGALKMIENDQKEYYLLSYAPARAAANSCHNLKVEALVPNSEVRARRQYCNFNATDPLQGTSTDEEMTAKASGSQGGGLATTLQAPFFYSEGGTGRLSIAAQFPVDSLKFVKSEKRLKATVNVLGIAYTSEGKVAARFSDTVPFYADNKGQIEQLKKTPYLYRTEFELAPGAYSLSLVVSPEAGVFGKTDMPVRIDDWDGKSLTVSGLAMSKHFAPAAANPDLESVLSANHIPLISGGTQFDPAPNSTFKKSEPAALYFEVYDPKLLEATPPRIYVEMHIVDRKTSELKVGTGPRFAQKWVRPGSAVVPVSFDLSNIVASLPPGQYRIFVKAMEAIGSAPAKDSPVRSQNFDVVE